jgi:uncharacterized iron-regulated membrane protein
MPGGMTAKLAQICLTDGYDVALPDGLDGVYIAKGFPPDPKQDPRSIWASTAEAVLKDICYADYGAVLKAASYGTSRHTGRYFEVANQIVRSLISAGVAAMAVTSAVTWRKRRLCCTDLCSRRWVSWSLPCGPRIGPCSAGRRDVSRPEHQRPGTR